MNIFLLNLIGYLIIIPLLKYTSNLPLLKNFISLCSFNENFDKKGPITDWEKLNTLDKKNEDLKISLAKKLTDQAFGIVTAKARILISEVLEENPYQIDALYLAGLTAFQNSRNDIAKKVWSTVFEINPETKYKNSINENLLKMK